MRTRRLIAATVAALAAVTSAATTTAEAAAMHRCYTPQLTASLGDARGAAGTTYYKLRFTNHAATACTLTGYPGVSFVRRSGWQAGPAAGRTARYPVRAITVSPGGTVWARLGVTAWQDYPPSLCHPVRVTRLRVYPPGAYKALTVPWAGWTCKARRVLHVTAVTRPIGEAGQ